MDNKDSPRTIPLLKSSSSATLKVEGGSSDPADTISFDDKPSIENCIGGGGAEEAAGVKPDLNPERIHTHTNYPDWNPMKELTDSFLNAFDMCEASGLLFGGGDMKTESILCPFNDGTGRCYKSVCRYKHVPYSSKDLNELPKLHYANSTSQESSVNAAISLPSQILPADGCISKITIVAAFDPGWFYAIPENGWRCLCNVQGDVTSGEESGDEMGDAAHSNLKQPTNFFKELKNIHTLLATHFDSCTEVGRCLEFDAGQLVAVKIDDSNGQISWYRAKVVEEPMPRPEDEDDVLKAGDIKLQLIDYGLICLKSSLDIAKLPEQFCRIAPLAYKCQLFGISPILGTWSTKAIALFKELVNGHCLIAEVVRTAAPNLYSSESDDACFLNLYVKTDGNAYVDITQHLIDLGLGLEWNLFQGKSYLNDMLNGRIHKFALS